MQTASLLPERRLTAPLDRLLIAMERRRIKMHNRWLPMALMSLIFWRIINARQRFYRIVERIRAGKIYRRKPAAPLQPTDKPPRQRAATPNPLFAKSGWMNRLMPGPESGHSQLALITLFEDPEMAPILAAAPSAIWRALRPLCQMLGVKRPAILAPPPRPIPPEPPQAAKAAKLPAAKAPKAVEPAPPEGPWPRIPSARWPKGVLTRPRKTA